MARRFAATLADYLGSSEDINTIQACTNISVFGWMNRRGAVSASGSRMFELGGGTGDGVRLQFASDNKANFIIARAGDKTTLGSTALTQDVWYHIGGTYDGTTRHVYVNGASEANSGTVSGDLDLADELFTIGNRNATKDRGWNGEIIEFGIWNRLLTSTEIAKLANGFAPSFIPSGLVFYTKVLGANNPEKDEVGGNSLSVNGSLAKSTHYDFIKYPGEHGNYIRYISVGNGMSRNDISR